MHWQGDLIKSKAEYLKIPITKLAENLGVSRQAVNDWIKGQIPKGMHIISLCKILDLTPDNLFGVQEDKSIIMMPLHRTRRTAKVTPEMQETAKKLVEEYKILFKNCDTPHLIPVERSGERSNKAAKIIAKNLRDKSGVNDNSPIDYHHVFSLINELGIFLIFRTFPDEVKSYAFYTRIYKHRVIFVNTTTNILDLIYPLLHETVHALRDELEITEDNRNDEEDFCDQVASLIQFPERYISDIMDTLEILPNIPSKIRNLKMFGEKNHHAMYGVVKRIEEVDPSFNLNIGGADTNLKKLHPKVGEIIFTSESVRELIDIYSELSPNFINLLKTNNDNISERKLGEYIEISNLSDIKEVREELAYNVKELV